MIHLSRLTGPAPVDLTDLYPGFKVVLRRLDAAAMAEAREAAVGVLRMAREGMEALAPYGLDQPDAQGRLLNPRSLDQMMRAGSLVGAVEVAIRALESWEGVCAEPPPSKVLAPINRSTLSILLQDDAVQRRLMREIDLAARILVTEGNASGPSPDGFSAMRPATAEAQPTAPAVDPPAQPAPRARRARAVSSAPQSKTRP